MLFSYNWLQSYFKKKLPVPKKLAELLTMRFFEVEEVKKIGSDFVLDINILPNRGSDCLSHIGVARECGALTKLKVKSKKLKHKVQSSKFNIKNFIKIEVKDKDACPRYTARVITDVKVGDSPKWLREKLKVCGLRSINNIVDATNYIMLETGQPLHAFDFEKIESVNPKSQAPNFKQIPSTKFQTKKIIVRRAKKGEKIISLDNEKYELDPDVLVIADCKEPLAVAGIKGGKKAEIDSKTKTIVLESANFNYSLIRKTSKKLKLKTDASWRFEHSLDPNLTEEAINRAAYLIQEISKGRIASGLIDVYPAKVLPKKIKLDLDYLNSLLGLEVPKKEIIKILKSLGFKVSRVSYSMFHIVVPTFRVDISLPEDLIEEIGRIYGYDKIKAEFPKASLIPPKRNDNIFWGNIIRDTLKEAGFCETYNYSFVGEKDFSIYQFNRYKSGILELENPLSSEFKYLRPNLFPNLLKDIRENSKYFKEIRIFELGQIFRKDAGKSNNFEKTKITGMIASQKDNKNFYRAKGTVDLLFNKLGCKDVWYDDYHAIPNDADIVWNPQRSAEIKVGNKKIGFLGEISPEILSKIKIPFKVAAFDFDFEELVRFALEDQEYSPVSRYPAIVRDIAILVPLETKVINVLNKINSVGRKLIRDIDIFDIYEGRELPDKKKNLAFHIIYQAKDRTMTAKEIDEIQNKIIKTLERNPAWEVRK